MQQTIRIALAGNPNCGKTTLFNAITGARQHVGNWPGVTVEKKEGMIRHEGENVQVIDLPGTYSLTAYSLEELIARNFLVEEKPDVVVNIVDASNLDRNLYLTTQILELGIPLIICLNMMDMAQSRGIHIDVEMLSLLLDVPIVPAVARTGKGVKAVLEAAVRVAGEKRPWKTSIDLPYGRDIEEAINDVERLIERNGFPTHTYPVHWMAVKMVEGDPEMERLAQQGGEIGTAILNRCAKLAQHLRSTLAMEPEVLVADYRYGFIMGVTRQVVKSSVAIRLYLSDKIDKVLTDRIIGPIILLLVLYSIYGLTFRGSEGPVELLNDFFAWMKALFMAHLAEGPIRSLLVSGIIDGVGGVLSFIPLIFLMFFCIAVLEDSGYMARVAYMMDRVLRWFGLHGNSVMSLIVGGGIMGGCAVPGVLASRTLRDPRERLATLLVTPLMNCGAKIPVYALLIGAFFAEHRARVMFILTLLSWAFALTGAKILRATILRGPKTPFVMELPPYRMPTLTGLFIHTWERTWQYLRKAGTTILAVSVLMWVFLTFPHLPMDRMAAFDNERLQAQQTLLADHAFRAFVPDPAALVAFSSFFRGFEAAKSGRKEDRVKAQSPFEQLAEAILSKKGVEAGQERGRAAEAFQIYRGRLAEIERRMGQAALRHTIAGRIGTHLEGVTGYLGFDWRINTALVGGFAAKEVIVSTLGTAHSLGNVDNEESMRLSERLREDPGWTPLTAFTLMVFTMLYSPCFITLVCIRKETGSIKWALFAVVYTTAMAFFICLGIRQVGMFLGLGV